MKRLMLFFVAIAGFSQSQNYDVIVAGCTTSGVAAAIAAAHLNAKVILVCEETKIGGQLITVPVMDDDQFSLFNPPPLIRELENQISNYYAQKAWAGVTETQPGTRLTYQPEIAEPILRQMIISQSTITLLTGIKFQHAIIGNKTVYGIILADGRQLLGKVIDATDLGDIIELAGIPAFVGNGTDTSPGKCIQSITWPAMVKKFPNQNLANAVTARIPACEPNYAEFAQMFASANGTGAMTWPALINYRGVQSVIDNLYTPAFPNPLITSDNFANDVPQSGIPSLVRLNSLSTTFLTNPVEREKQYCAAKLKTLCSINYYQAPFGLNQPTWGIDVSAYNSPGLDASCNLPPEFQDWTTHLAPFAYIRESRRIQGLKVLTTATANRQLQSDGTYRGSPLTDAVAVDSYMQDLHGCIDDLEVGENSSNLYGHSGPFQIPYGSFIPKDWDGLMAGEKNISTYRIVGPRVQKAVASIGLAAGVAMAEAARRQVRLADINPWWVQRGETHQGGIISLCSYDDVPFFADYKSSSLFLWEAVQLVSTRQIMVGDCHNFLPNQNLSRREMAVIITKLFDLALPHPTTATFEDVPATDWAFPFIEALYRYGLITGCSQSPRRFCPSDIVTKEQLSIFLMRGLGMQGPSMGTWLSAAQAVHIMAPCNSLGDCSSQPITRGETALSAVWTIDHITGY